MTGRLEDKIVLVTGADSGIGKTTGLTFAKEGATLVRTGGGTPEYDVDKTM